MAEVPGVTPPGEGDAADTMTRIVELADSARRARQIADATGTAQTKARAQAAELAVLNILVKRLDITSVTPVYLSSMTAALAHVVQGIVSERPETRADVLAMMRQHTALVELADKLATRTQEQQ
ncbi:hypothetical protein [Microbacterium sp. LWS13-1.2]|uniref:Uncharacterized protein n=1 Tax=Microbacterium sp. LWS13-1.2 TaxID=3135264 RepID=A0AAU6S7K5_9MICO